MGQGGGRVRSPQFLSDVLCEQPVAHTKNSEKENEAKLTDRALNNDNCIEKRAFEASLTIGDHCG